MQLLRVVVIVVVGVGVVGIFGVFLLLFWVCVYVYVYNIKLFLNSLTHVVNRGTDSGPGEGQGDHTMYGVV